VSFRDITVGLYGAFQLARMQKSASRCFENTPEAFWRSFQAAIVAVPAYCLLQLLNLAEMPVASAPFRILIVELSAYIIGWVLFPFIMITVTNALGKADNYFQYIVAWNWAIVLQICFYLVVVSIAVSGLLPPSISAFMGFGAVVAFLFYQGFITCVMLDVRPAVAVMIVLLDFVIAIILNQISRSLYFG